MVRKWLSAMLRGDCPGREFPDGIAHEDISDSANAEGVVALLHECVNNASQTANIPSEFKVHLAALAHGKARQSLMREAECRRILARFQQAHIKALLLKGSALAYWLYPSAHLRDCSDIDFLFPSHDEAQKAVVLLKDMQYSLRDLAVAGDLVSFEYTCVRDSKTGTGLEIDLHWRLSSSALFAYQFDFDELNANAIMLPKLGQHAFGLSPLHAFFNACMHRVQNMQDHSENCLKWLYDLHLLCLQFTPSDWKRLVDLAVERKLAGVCLDGLLHANDEFDSPIPDAIFDALANASKLEHLQVSKMHGWFYSQRMTLLAFPSMQLRMRWLRQRLLPDRNYLRTRYGNRNIASLLLQRLKAGFQRIF